MSAIDKFKDRYRGLGRIRVYVPELDLEIWSQPYTIHDEHELMQQVGGKIDTPEGFLAFLIRKAEDANGRPLFAPTDMPTLKRIAESNLVKAIVLRIIAADSDDPQESPEGKSEATP